ncbi:MAG: hypothetical protein LUD69_07960 [Oscillospiraceae bacterium]|nr:hypothetical protein [Oscillospiraceae bacterium]
MATTELDELGESSEDCADGISKYREEVKALTGVDIMIDDNTYRDVYDIFVDIANVWNDLSDTAQARVSEILGGTRQLSGVSSTITNIADAIGAYESAMDSAGAATEANDIYMETTTAHIAQLNAATQELGSDLFNQDMFKTFFDGATKAIEAIDVLVSHMGMIGTGGLAGLAAGFKSIFSSASNFSKQLSDVSSIANSIGTATTWAANYADAIEGCNDATKNLLLSSGGLSTQQQTLVQNILKARTGISNLTAAEVMDELTKQGLITAEETETVMKELNITKTQKLTESQLTAAYASGTLTESQYNTAMALVAESTAAAKATTSTTSFSTAIKGAMATNPVGWIMLIVSTLVSLYSIVKNNTDLFSTTSERLEKLQSDLEELEETIDSAASSFKELRETLELDSDATVIDEFAELAKGVNQFGENVDLTEDEYERFTELQSTLAELFPSIDNGLNSNGEQMLALSYSSDTLAESLYALADAELAAYQQEIADTMPDLVKDIAKETKIYQNQLSDLEDQYTVLTALSSGYANYSDVGRMMPYQDVADLLESYGLSASQDIYGMSVDLNTDEALAAYESALATLEQEIKQVNDEVADAWTDLNPVITSWLSTDYTYNELSDEMQDLLASLIGNIDFSELGYGTADDIQSYIKTNFLVPIYNASDEVQEAWSDLIAVDTSDTSYSKLYNTIHEYANVVADGIGQDVEDIVSSLYGDTLETYNDKIIALTEEFQESSFYATSAAEDAAESMTRVYSFWLNNLEVGDLDLVYTLSLQEDTSGWTLRDWQDNLEKLREYTDATNFTIDIDAETEGLEAVNTALAETASATGLTSDSIETLKERYQDLEDFDADALFENTSYGVRLNTTELKKLEDEYEAVIKTGFDEKLEELADEYNEAKSELSSYLGDVDAYNEKLSELDAIEAQIEETEILASQYGALTSAYNEWQNAMNTDNQRDTYESIGASYEDMQDILNAGWYNDDSLQSYLDLLLGEENRTGDALKDFAKLSETIAGTTHSIMDYWAYDEDGNLLSNGLVDFLEDVRQVMGEDYVWLDEEGSYVFDLTGDKIQEVADRFGMGTEAIEYFITALGDVSGTVALEDISDTLDLITTRAEDAIATLQGIEGLTDFEFDLNTSDVDELQDDLAEAQRIYDSMLDENGILNLDIEGADDAYALPYAINLQIQQIEQPAIMTVDTSSFKEGYEIVADAAAKIIEYGELVSQLKLYESLGKDTTDIVTDLQEVSAELSNISKDAYISLGLDTETIEEIKSITSECSVELDQDSVDAVMDILGSIDVDDLPLECDTDAVEEAFEYYEEYQFGDKTIVVTVSGGALKDLRVIQSVVDDLSGASIAIGTASNADGTAHATGTAKASGDWSVGSSGESLGGELGQELVVLRSHAA